MYAISISPGSWSLWEKCPSSSEAGCKKTTKNNKMESMPLDRKLGTQEPGNENPLGKMLIHILYSWHFTHFAFRIIHPIFQFYFSFYFIIFLFYHTSVTKWAYAKSDEAEILTPVRPRPIGSTKQFHYEKNLVWWIISRKKLNHTPSEISSR